MNVLKSVLVCCLLSTTFEARAQGPSVIPQVRVRDTTDGKVVVVEVAAHFVTAIRLPEAVNSIAVGDPTLFQVEHSEHEPQLVLVKALTQRNAQTNLLISSVHGRMFSLLLTSRGNPTGPEKVDFLLQYKPAARFLVEPEIVPFPVVGETRAIIDQLRSIGMTTDSADSQLVQDSTAVRGASRLTRVDAHPDAAIPAATTPSLDALLERQKAAPLPAMYGERIETEAIKGDRLRVGVSEVIDGGQEVTVLFSVVNTSRHAILLMPPQVQLGGKIKTGRIVKHDRWSSAEQLATNDFRLSARRLGPGNRADGVVIFERPPYKQSNEALFLQMADSGAVDHPALAPIGFGVSSFHQEDVHGTGNTRN